MIFHIKIGQFPFHTLTNSVRLPIITDFAAFHTKIMLVIYDMGLFFNSTICGVTFDTKDLIFNVIFSLKILLQTASVSGENRKSLGLRVSYPNFNYPNGSVNQTPDILQ